MEYVEEEARPRFLFQSRAASSSSSSSIHESETLKINKYHAAACFFAASLLLFSAFSFFQSQTVTFLLIWTSLSLFIAPFAPSSVTGGDVRVGHGDPLPPSDPTPPETDESKKRIPGRRIRSWKPDNPSSDPPVLVVAGSVEKNADLIRNGSGSAKEGRVEESEGEKDWTDEDYEILKKQISKHPVGEPKRWERIAEAFQGRHGLDSVIKTAKSLSEKRSGAGDSFAQFLKQRKPLDKRSEVVDGESNGQILLERENGGWSSREDIALLNALKAFPKDVSMRWEKIAAAVPAKSKACCMKRIAELKKDFRSSKASET